MGDIASMEYIRYSWGTSSLGEFIAAWGDNGVVHFEFADHKGHALDHLRRRFPTCLVVEDIAGLAPVIRKLAYVVDHPDEDPGLPLDLRGSDFEKRVWKCVREIPAETTASYGDIAAKLGAGDVRDVTAAIASNNIAILVPCHRVIKKDGSLSGYRWGARRKRALLDREQRTEEFAN